MTDTTNSRLEVPAKEDFDVTSGMGTMDTATPDINVFGNLMILPPLQKQQQQQTTELHLDAFRQGMVVQLPPLRAEEPVAR